MSHKVAIVTDSTADIPEELIRKYGIHIVPLRVLFGEETYADGVDLTSEQFYEKLKKVSVLPTTSQPSPTDFMNVYQTLLDENPERPIVSIHLSSGMSGTYQSAMLGKSLLEREGDITVLDSKSASYGYGLMVVQAAELAEQGKSAVEITTAIEGMQQSRKLFFLVDTLEYLQKAVGLAKLQPFWERCLTLSRSCLLMKKALSTQLRKSEVIKKQWHALLSCSRRILQANGLTWR